MFFREALRRRLSSLLQPWLLEEPEIELELGIINSRLTARSLNLDASSLNPFLDSSCQFSLAKVNVELFSVRFSNWSAPALTVEVRGVNVVLSAGEMKEDERLSRARRRTSEDAYEEKKKRVAGLDPQGSDVHDLLERMFSTSCSSRSFKTSLLHAVLAHCSLRIFDICLEVQYPSVNDAPQCLAELKSLNIESDNLERCFVRQLTEAIIIPQKETSFVMDFRGFDIGYRMTDQSDQVVSSADLVAYAKLSDLHLIDFSVHASEWNLLLSPIDLPVLSIYVKTFSNKSKRVRNGRELWKIAANRLRYANLSPRLSLYNLVEFVCLWLQYLGTYECLLLLVDYADKGSLKMVIPKMCKDKMLLNSVKHRWLLISGFEKELPAEYIAQARRIARHRVTMSIQHRQSNYMSSTSGLVKVFSKAFQGLSVIWNTICRILLILRCFCFTNLFLQKPEVRGILEVKSEDYFPEFRVLIYFGKISITLFPVLDSQSANEQLEPVVGISISDLYSFCLSMDDLLCLYVDKTFEQSMFISFGQLKVNPSCKSTSSTEIQSKDNFKFDNADKQMPSKYLKSVLWSEPAQTLVSVQPGTAAGGQVEGACYGFLKEIIGELWLAWERTCIELDTREVEYSENPWFLCQIKNRLTRPDLNTSDFGFCECCLTFGKLNLSLGYQSMLSALILCQQIEQALSFVKDEEMLCVLSQTTIVQEVQDTDLGIKYENFVGVMKKTLFSMVPEKQIRLGMFITGLDIELLSSQAGLGCDGQNGNSVLGQSGLQVGVDFRSIEVAIWPSSKYDTGLLGYHGVEPQGPRLRDPVKMEIPRIENEKYASHGWVSLGSYMKVNGLNITVREMVGRQDCGYIAVKPITLQLSLFRESVHSFGSTVIAFSTALNVTATKFSVFSCMDEVEDLFKVVAGLFCSPTNPYGGFDLVGCSHDTYMRLHMVFEEAGADHLSMEGAPLIQSILLCKTESSFAFREMDMILQKSRIYDRFDGHIDIEDAFGSEENSVIPDPSSYGIRIFVHQSNLDISCEECKLEFHAHLAEIRYVIFRYADMMQNSSTHSGSYNLVQQAHSCTHEISLPNCKVAFLLSERRILDKSLEGYSLVNIARNSHLTNEAETLSIPSYTSSQSSDFTSSITNLSASYCVIINAELDAITVSRCSAKKLVTAHHYDKLASLLLLGGDLQSISLEIQGGPLFLDVKALSLLGQCFASFLHRITDIVSIINSSSEHTQCDERRLQETSGTTQQLKWELPQASTLNVSELSVVLAVEDGSGGFQEFEIRVDICMKFQSQDILRELVFQVSRMSIFSQVIREQLKTGNQTPHFSSVESTGPSPVYQGPAMTSRLMYGSHISHRSDILKHLIVSVTAEKPNNGTGNLAEVWVGQGSISGFDITISLSEIEMISSLLSSISPAHAEETTNDTMKKRWSTDQGNDSDFTVMVPDGAIVSVQDVHQHMYFAVQGEGDKYDVVGTIHYSLSGDRALFRVKHHVQRVWKSSTIWFSLISLHAKNHDGEPFRLSYRPGSSFVDICSTSDNAGSLWRIVSREPESSTDEIDWEPYNRLVMNTFYLVNKKNDYAVAFVNGIPEFVRKPGNPFKFKVFRGSILARAITSDCYLPEPSGSGTNVVPAVHQDQSQSSMQSGGPPCVQIQSNSINITIVHELLDSKDKSPLLRCCINNSQINVQVLSSKTRVMSTSTASLFYFDSQRSEWVEFAHPVDLCIFYRSRVESKTNRHKLPVDIYCRTNEVHISLSELALDVLLFVIGKLDLAGPFSVRSSKILSNCCKVENQSGLELTCHLSEGRSIKVVRGKYASIFLRDTSADQRVENTSGVTVQLSNGASWITSAVQLSVLRSQTVAWRTRIMSPQDSRTHPGPFIVVDISRRSEDGLKIVVSPLIRIHNETGFSMELRFKRPQEIEDVFASVFLKTGDAIDDTLATFDAINSSGGLKKTLMSLSVGNFLFSFRPEVPEGSFNSISSVSVGWSDDFKGGKAVRLSGIFDKLGYKVRKALSVDSMTSSFSTAYCSIKSKDAHITDLHFLIQSIGRDIPIGKPDTSNDGSESRSSAVALREQREIFILPTVQVSNLLHFDIQVLLTERDVSPSCSVDIGKQATVPSGSAVNFYANPAMIYFTVTLTAFGSSCKPVNSGDWVKKLHKNKSDVSCLDIDLEFGGGKYFASLRLSRGPRGVLEGWMQQFVQAGLESFHFL